MNIFNQLIPITGHINVIHVDWGNTRYFLRLTSVLISILYIIQYIFSFKTERLLKSHQKSHTEHQFKCTQCEKSFRHKHSLEKHKEYHTGSIAKPFICDICGKGFRINANLVVCSHLLVHPFSPKKIISFSFRMSIQEHRRIHTGEKPFACEHCLSHFRTMSSFYGHLKKMHGSLKNYILAYFISPMGCFA